MADTDQPDVKNKVIEEANKQALSKSSNINYQNDDPLIGKTILCPISHVFGIIKYEPCVITCFDKFQNGYRCYPEDHINTGSFYVVSKAQFERLFENFNSIDR